MGISAWSSDVCDCDLRRGGAAPVWLFGLQVAVSSSSPWLWLMSRRTGPTNPAMKTALSPLTRERSEWSGPGWTGAARRVGPGQTEGTGHTPRHEEEI